MPKTTIKKLFITTGCITNLKKWGWLNTHLLRSELWYFNRRSVATAALIGLFVSMMPVPMQMLIAAAGAVVFSANLPVAVMLVWMSNPLTIIPISWLSLCAGCWLLQLDMNMYSELLVKPWGWHTLQQLFAAAWQPLIAGSVFIGLILGLFGYYLTHYLWRAHTLQRWQTRKTQRENK